jgi:hypothetical protein
MWVVLACSFALRCPGLVWGMPGSDGWDDDGVAPRDFLVGVIQTYSFGDYYTYPPLHLLLLTCLTAPVWLFGLARAPGLTPSLLVAHFIEGPYMTLFAVMARVLSIVMSVATIYLMGKITGELARALAPGASRQGLANAGAGREAVDRSDIRRAEATGAVVGALNVVLTYYGQTSNLDGPYVFWATLSLWLWQRVLGRGELRLLRPASIAMVCAVATKDQAYAFFLVSLPIAYLVFWRIEGRATRELWSNTAKNVALSLALLLAIDGAWVNPTGFWRRLHFLLGPASQAHAYYQRDLSGRLQILRDMFLLWNRFYEPAWLSLAITGAGIILLVGAAVAAREARHKAVARAAGSGVAQLHRDSAAPQEAELAVHAFPWAAALLPLLFGISFTLAFNVTARRTEARFALPLCLAAVPYMGLFVGWVFQPRSALWGWLRWALLALALPCLYRNLAIVHGLADDPRYQVEDYLASHAFAEHIVEFYGNNVYLPRIRGPFRAIRVGTDTTKTRNPLPGVLELQASYETARNADFIVVSQFWVAKYLYDPYAGPGYIVQSARLGEVADFGARSYFRRLMAGEGGYHVALRAKCNTAFWPLIDIHESVCQEVIVLQRNAPLAPNPPPN